MVPAWLLFNAFTAGACVITALYDAATGQGIWMAATLFMAIANAGIIVAGLIAND